MGTQKSYLWLVALAVLAFGLAEGSGCKEGSKFAHPDSCRHYLQCEGGKMVAKSCGLIWGFDTKTTSCLIMWNAHCGHPECPEGQKIPLPKSTDKECKKYTECLNGKKLNQSCYVFRNFNPTSQNCEYSYDCSKSPECIPGERKAIEGDCKYYMECSSSGKYERKKCFSGFSFDKKAKQCEISSDCPECKGWSTRAVRDDPDCQKYQICEKGNIADKSCWLLRRFDPVKNICRWRWSVDCKPPKKLNKSQLIDKSASASTTESTPAPATSASTSSSAPSTASTAKTTTVPPTPAKCTTNKPIEGNCKDYMQCQPDGTYVKATCRFCKLYSAKEQKCVWSWKSGCTVTTTALPVTTEDPKCTKENEKRAIDCKNYEVCQKQTWVHQSCSLFYKFDKNKLECRFTWFATC